MLDVKCNLNKVFLENFTKILPKSIVLLLEKYNHIF